MAVEDEIVVAVAGPMTGPLEKHGSEFKIGAELAVRHLNSAGGIDGRKLRLTIEDDQCDRPKAIQIAQRLVERHIDLVVGHVCPGTSQAAAPFYAAAGIIQIASGRLDSTPATKRAGPTQFRLLQRRSDEGMVSGAYLAKNFAGKRVAILHDRTLIGMDYAAGTKRSMNAAGLTEVLYSGFIAGERDYSKLAMDLRAQRIDVIYLGAFRTEAALITRNLRDAGMATIVFGSNLLKNGPSSLANETPEDGTFISSYLASHRLPGSSRLELSEPNPYGWLRAMAYSSIEIWAKALKETVSHGSNPRAVAAQIQQGSTGTVFGEIKFELDGDVSLPVHEMFVWKNGQLVLAP